MTKAELDRLDERVLTSIHSFQIREGFAPSRDEIARDLRLPNLHTAQRAVERLSEMGRLQFEKNSKRGIEIAGQQEKLARIVELRLLGTVAAGRPIEAIEGDERIQVPAFFIRGAAPHFVLRVKGNSMIDDHILDGDFVIVKSQSTANNGEKVVALIDNEATLKRFYQKQGRIELHPANEMMTPIVVEAHQQLRIAGVYVGHLHKEQ
jgi:repressor LexA